MFTVARCTQMQTKNRGEKICTKIKPIYGLSENQTEDISIHSVYIYNHEKKKSNFKAIFTNTYTYAHTSIHACMNLHQAIMSS